MSKLFTVRSEAAKPDCPFSEYRLRLLIAARQCPGVRVGNRFLIDHDELIAQTKAAAVANAGKEMHQL